jgi:F-type H+-transporting ATPase subunit delta
VRRPGTAARRYAEAAFQIAARDGATDEWQERLGRLAGVLDDARMARLAGNPALPPAERERVLLAALGWEGIDDPAVNLVRLLLRRGRIGLAGSIAAEFHRLVQRSRGIVGATVWAAAPLSAAEEDAVRRRLEAMTGRQVDLTVEIDPELIGGVAVRIGDRMIDASVRGRLRRLRERLVAGAAA